MSQPHANRDGQHLPSWRQAGLRYHTYGHHLRQLFGRRVRRVSLDAKLTCPNVDGTVAKGGCVFCDNRSFSPSRRLKLREITKQIDEAITRIRHKYTADAFLAYFQPATNTYAPAERLRAMYEEALEHPEIIGLVIGTRPDCVPDDVLDLLEEFAGRGYLSVEYGLQTIHNRSLDWMNRGHHYDAFPDAMARSAGRGFEIGVHLILGLPGETRDDVLETVETVSQFPISSVKIHNLYAVKNTPLAEWVQQGTVQLMQRDEYVSLVVDVLERLPPEIVVERTSGEAPPNFLIGPDWCLRKAELKLAIEAELQRRDTYQGRLAAGVAGHG